MKNTALTKTHIALGAKMLSFAGYNMPMQYEGVTIEHQTVRNNVGVFDISHMGVFIIEGPNALALVQKTTCNDVTKLTVGKAQYSCIPNDTGGIVDDLIIYRIKQQTYLLVVNAANIEKDWNYITSKNDVDAILRNISEDYAILAIQGPKAIEALQNLSSHDLSTISSYNFIIGNFADIKNVIISATGYTGSGGIEIYCKNSEVKHIWDKVMEVGKAYGIRPIGLAARDTLRLEMGYCLYGNDIDDTTSPIEAGLSWICKFNHPFTRSEVLKAEKERTPKQKLVAFKLEDRGIPRQGYDIVDGNGCKIGRVTSGTMSPSLAIGIGLGYVPKVFSKIGSKIYIQIRKKVIPAIIVKLPFYKG